MRLGAALGVAVVAEGIADPVIAGRLAALGCPLGQGYLFGRPGPINSVVRRFAEPAVRVLPGGLDAASRHPDSVALH